MGVVVVALLMMWSGAFSRISAGSWNGRSILCDDLLLAMRKGRVVAEHAQVHQHFALQELGGSEQSIEEFKNKYQSTHFVGLTVGDGPARGVASLHLKRSFSKPTFAGFEALIPGRALISTIDDMRGKHVVYNIHFFQLTREDKQLLKQRLGADIYLSNTPLSPFN